MSLFNAVSKRARGRALRKRRRDSDDEGDNSSDDEKELRSVLDDVACVQRLRCRPSGLSAEQLAHGAEAGKTKHVKSTGDPLKLQQDGMVDLKALSSRDLKDVDLEDSLRQQFSKESHLRDEDEEMRKYVDAELIRRKADDDGSTDAPSTSTQPPESSAAATPFVSAEDRLFAEAAERMKKYEIKRKEDMLSNQMLCGIPEVDLGIDTRIRNIEETEAAKLRLLKETREKQRNLQLATAFTQDAQKNAACDFVKHRKYNIDESTALGHQDSFREPKPDDPPKATAAKPIPVVGEDTPRYMLPDQGGKIVSKAELPVPSDPKKAKKKKQKLTVNKMKELEERRSFATGHGATVDFEHIERSPNHTPDHSLDQLMGYPHYQGTYEVPT